MEQHMKSVGETPPITVTIAEARRLSGIGNTKLFELIRDKKLDTVTVGRRRLIHLSSLERLLSPEAVAA
jgi:excisionase family DNA binding protein